jgi:hypothetical protein
MVIGKEEQAAELIGEIMKHWNPSSHHMKE